MTIVTHFWSNLSTIVSVGQSLFARYSLRNYMGNWDAFRDYRRSTICQKIAGSRPVPKRDPLWENCFMLGHIGVNVRDLEQAKAYYHGLMPLLGFEPYITATDQFAYRPVNSKPGAFLFFYPALEEAL